MNTVDFRKERLELSQKRLWLAIAILAAPLAGYVAAFVITLAVPVPLGVLFAGLMGWLMGSLFIVGHDACHQSFTASRRLNEIIGRLAYLPTLHSASMWDISHNRIHHRFNNVRAIDYVWEPMSPAEYAAATPMRRLIYRFSRSPVGVFTYYPFAIWFPKMFLLRRKVYGEFKAIYLWDGIIVWAFLLIQCAAAVWIGGMFGKGPIISISLAIVLPFIVWNVLMSFIIYLHHTHPNVAWYPTVEAWRDGNGAVAATVHVRFPWLVRKLTLEIMEHNAHHYAPGVPLYNLETMQENFNPSDVVTWTWSTRGFLRLVRRCKLFDYEANTWTGFPA